MDEVPRFSEPDELRARIRRRNWLPLIAILVLIWSAILMLVLL